MHANKKKHDFWSDCWKIVVLFILMSASLYLTALRVHESGILEMFSIPKVDFFNAHLLDDDENLGHHGSTTTTTTSDEYLDSK